MKNALKRVLYTLGTIEVKGKENLDALLGCIMTLETVVSFMGKTDVKNEEAAENDTHNQQGENV